MVLHCLPTDLGFNNISRNIARVMECTIKGRFSNSNVPVLLLEMSAARECPSRSAGFLLQKYLPPVSGKGD